MVFKWLAGLAQLAVLAATTVVAAHRRIFLVLFRLAIDAVANAGNSLTTGFGNCSIAFHTILKALALRQLVSDTLDRILDGCVDLVLYCAVFRESACHQRSLNETGKKWGQNPAGA